MIETQVLVEWEQDLCKFDEQKTDHALLNERARAGWILFSILVVQADELTYPATLIYTWWRHAKRNVENPATRRGN